MQVHCFFHKHISAEMLMEVNEYLLDHKDDNKDDHTSPSGGKTSDDDTAKEDTINVLEKSILRLPKAESTWQRESVARSADSWPI